VRVAGQLFLIAVEGGAALGGDTAPASPSVAPAPFAVLSTKMRAGADPSAPAAAFGAGQQLTAPLPGTITSVAVKPGQAVQRGDELLTIEAMKMFNVIRSPRAGTIAEVRVAEGSRVAHGDALITFAPG
jgi:biotin carboxyl carrier protein